MEYSFDIEMAKKYGLEEAIMIKNFQYWINKNNANNKNIREDRVWTYNSVEALSKLFPFWSPKQIRRILQSLIAQEVLIIGNYNKIKMDRTRWYAFKDEELFLFTKRENDICPNGKMTFAQTVTPIPYNKPYNNKPININNETCNNVTDDDVTHVSNKDKNTDERNNPFLPLAELLYTEHRKQDENYLAGKDLKEIFKRWANDIRLLVNNDKRDIETVREIIIWCQSPGNFWVPNILSGSKLRQKFPTLYSQYMAEKKKPVKGERKLEPYQQEWQDKYGHRLNEIAENMWKDENRIKRNEESAQDDC